MLPFPKFRRSEGQLDSDDNDFDKIVTAIFFIIQQ